MIKLTRLNGAQVSLNADLVETIESAPDTTVTLVTGNRFLVRETVDQVIEKVVAYKKAVHAGKPVVNPVESFVKK